MEHNIEDDFEFYLKNSIPVREIIAILSAQKRDKKEIDTFINKYETSKKHVVKMLNKFLQKVEYKYGTLDETTLLGKGIKYTKKHTFTESEKAAFLHKVIKGNIENPLVPDEFSNTEMSKLFGLDARPAILLDIKAIDQAALSEIVKKYGESKLLYTSVLNQSYGFQDTNFMMINTQYDNTVNKHIYIHPIIVALFCNKINCVDKKMIIGNIGRMIAMRAKPLITFPDTAISKEQLTEDMNIMIDIIRDPSGIAYFSKDTPIENLLKRYMIQINLWYNILFLRDFGKVYSKNSFNSQDEISAFMDALSAYEWAYYDSPELLQQNDANIVLNKLLAVFSWRPIDVQVLAGRAGTDVTGTLGMQSMHSSYKTQFMRMPIINIKLPNTLITVPNILIELTGTFSQTEWLLENKMFVPRTRKFYSAETMLFFNIPRKYQNTNPQFGSQSLPNLSFAFSGLMPMGYNQNATLEINLHRLNIKFPDHNIANNLQIEQKNYLLRSLIRFVDTGDIATGIQNWITQTAVWSSVYNTNRTPQKIYTPLSTYVNDYGIYDFECNNIKQLVGNIIPETLASANLQDAIGNRLNSLNILACAQAYQEVCNMTATILVYEKQ